MYHKPEDCLHITDLEAVCSNDHLYCIACSYVCPECGERETRRPRKDYVRALVTAMRTVPGHLEATRHRYCNHDQKQCMDVLSIGSKVISRE